MGDGTGVLGVSAGPVAGREEGKASPVGDRGVSAAIPVAGGAGEDGALGDGAKSVVVQADSSRQATNRSKHVRLNAGIAFPIGESPAGGLYNKFGGWDGNLIQNRSASPS